MNGSHLKRQKLDELHSELDELVRKSEQLIADFQRLTRKVPRQPYSFLGFFRKKRNAEACGKFRSVDNKLAEAVEAIAYFRANNSRYLTVSTQAYIVAYEEYLQSVKTAAELRVAFEQKIMGIDMSTSSTEDVDHMKKLSTMIGPSLEDCERKGQKVNQVINSFKR
ncbi:hypothetical protein VU02_03345 [Desulfobulbus sp. N2]|nr:hypothetical protein [Desulfobulbus sp. N2]